MDLLTRGEYVIVEDEGEETGGGRDSGEEGRADSSRLSGNRDEHVEEELGGEEGVLECRRFDCSLQRSRCF